MEPADGELSSADCEGPASTGASGYGHVHVITGDPSFQSLAITCWSSGGARSVGRRGRG